MKGIIANFDATLLTKTGYSVKIFVERIIKEVKINKSARKCPCPKAEDGRRDDFGAIYGRIEIF